MHLEIKNNNTYVKEEIQKFLGKDLTDDSVKNLFDYNLNTSTTTITSFTKKLEDSTTPTPLFISKDDPILRYYFPEIYSNYIRGGNEEKIY